MTMDLALRLAGAFVVALAALFLGASHAVDITNEHAGVAVAIGAAIYAYRQIGRFFDERESGGP